MADNIDTGALARLRQALAAREGLDPKTRKLVGDIFDAITKPTKPEPSETEILKATQQRFEEAASTFKRKEQAYQTFYNKRL